MCLIAFDSLFIGIFKVDIGIKFYLILVIYKKGDGRKCSTTESQCTNVDEYTSKSIEQNNGMKDMTNIGNNTIRNLV